MRVSVTGRGATSPPDLRPAGELAPSLALPWIVRLRYGVLAGQALLILLTHFVFKVELAIGWLAIPLALTAASNLLIYRVAERFGARPALGYLLTFDTICLTALLALSGGPTNPFTLLYLVQITLSAVVLSKQWTWVLGLLSALGFAFLFWANVRVSVFEAHHTVGGFSVHLVGMWIAFAAGALLITVFIGKVSEALRRREQEVLQLQDQLARHERLASVATLAAGAAHELGTPLATIAVASKELEFYCEPDRQGPAGCRRRPPHPLRGGAMRPDSQTDERPRRGAAGRSAGCGWDCPDLLESVRRASHRRPASACSSPPAGDGGSAVLPVEATKQALTALVKNALEASGERQPVRLGAERTAKECGSLSPIPGAG